MKPMEVHFTPEQEAQLALIATNAGTDAERLVKQAALRLLTLGAAVDSGAVPSESGGGGKSPRSRMGAVDAGWAMAPASEAWAAPASAAPSVKDKPIAQTMTFADNNWPEPPSQPR